MKLPMSMKLARPNELQPAPLLAPRWAPNVVVVSRHMPDIGLSWGLGALVAPEAVDALDAWVKQRIANTLGVPRFRALVRR